MEIYLSRTLSGYYSNGLETMAAGQDRFLSQDSL